MKRCDRAFVAALSISAVLFSTSYGMGRSESKTFFTDSPLSLDELLVFARQNNPGLKSAYSEWEAAKKKAPQVSSLPDPRLMYGYLAEPIQTKTGPQEQRIGISQTFPWFGKRSLQEQRAVKEADAFYQEYISQKLFLNQKIADAFYEYGYLREAIKVNNEHLELLRLMESVAATRFKSGKLPQSTLIQIQIEQGKLEDRVKELEALRMPLSSDIYSAMGVESGAVLPWPAEIAANFPDLDDDMLKASLLQKNPSLKKMALLSEKEEYGVKLAKKDYFPDITLGIEQMYVEGGANPTVATAAINLPIWRGRLHAARQEALKRRESMDEELIDSEHRLSAKLELIVYYYRDAQRKVSLYTKTLIPKAQQAIDIALKGFETGDVGFSDVLDAERTLLDFQLNAERMRADANKRLAEIEALANIDVT